MDRGLCRRCRPALNVSLLVMMVGDACHSESMAPCRPLLPASRYPLAEQTAEHEEFPHLGRPVSRLIRPTDLEKARHLSTSANAPWHRLLMYARLRPWFRFFVDAQTSGESIHGEQPIGTM